MVFVWSRPQRHPAMHASVCLDILGSIAQLIVVFVMMLERIRVEMVPASVRMATMGRGVIMYADAIRLIPNLAIKILQLASANLDGEGRPAAFVPLAFILLGFVTFFASDRSPAMVEEVAMQMAIVFVTPRIGEVTQIVPTAIRTIIL
jgi:hypothetical protein